MKPLRPARGQVSLCGVRVVGGGGDTIQKGSLHVTMQIYGQQHIEQAKGWLWWLLISSMICVLQNSGGRAL